MKIEFFGHNFRISYSVKRKRRKKRSQISQGGYSCNLRNDRHCRCHDKICCSTNPGYQGTKLQKTQKLTQILNFYCTWQVHIFAMSALKGEVYNATFVIGVEEIAWLFSLIAANSQVLSHSVEKSILKVSLKKIQKKFRTKNKPLNSKKYLIVESRARFLSVKFKNETFLVIFKHCDMLCKKTLQFCIFCRTLQVFLFLMMLKIEILQDHHEWKWMVFHVE